MSHASKKPATLKDIALLAKCSTAAVSTVLNNSKSTTIVSDAVKQRVMEIATELNYRPNYASRSLKSHRSRTIGLYIQNGPWHNLSNFYEMSIFRGVEKAIGDFGYDLLLINVNSNIMPEKCAAKLLENRIDGVVILHADPDSAAWIDELLAISHNVVAIDYNRRKANLDAMMFDNYAGVEIALRYLAGLGHRRIGFIGHGVDTPHLDVVERETAFRQLTGQLGLDNDDALLCSGDKFATKLSLEQQYCQAEGEYGIRYFHRLPQPPTAILAWNGLSAVSAVLTCAKLNWRVPDEISILGIDNSDYCYFCSPALSVVDHRLEDMGYQGVVTLINRLENNVTETTHRIFAPFIIERESTAPHQY